MTSNKNRPTGPTAAANAEKNQSAEKPAANQTPPEAVKPKIEPEQLLKAWFTGQKHSEDQGNRSEAVKKAAYDLGLVILKNTQPSADQTASLRKLRELTMTLVQAIGLEELGK